MFNIITEQNLFIPTAAANAPPKKTKMPNVKWWQFCTSETSVIHGIVSRFEPSLLFTSPIFEETCTKCGCKRPYSGDVEFDLNHRKVFTETKITYLRARLGKEDNKPAQLIGILRCDEGCSEVDVVKKLLIEYVNPIEETRIYIYRPGRQAIAKMSNPDAKGNLLHVEYDYDLHCDRDWK